MSEMISDESNVSRVLAQLKSETGDVIGAPFDLPLDITVDQLRLICNAVLQKEETSLYTFFVNDEEITDNLLATQYAKKDLNTEKVVEIVYQPQAVFQVQAVTRCTSTMPGHAEAVISVSFSPDGSHLASGSGDTTVRFWDVNIETPHFTAKGHKHWVLCIAWSPDGKKLASACKNGQILIWDPKTGLQVGKPLVGHRQWVTCLSWEPFHKNAQCRRLASSSKDTLIRIWDTIACHVLLCLSSHTASVTCVKWGGSGLLYSSSQDRTIKVWRADDGVMCRTLEGHAHWVNTLAVNTDYVTRTGFFEPADADKPPKTSTPSPEELMAKAQKRYDAVKGNESERLVSGSDDFTLILWQPEKDKKQVARMTGHQQLINDVKFSPDARLIASASFDKSIKIWDGRTGKYITSLRGHVQAVYQVSWAADSRLLVSGSADSTLKVWDLKTGKLAIDLPGHADEIYAVDWSPNSERVISGGKDKVLKMWRR